MGPSLKKWKRILIGGFKKWNVIIQKCPKCKITYNIIYKIFYSLVKKHRFSYFTQQFSNIYI